MRDVRHRSEWCAGHLTGALHVPLPELDDARSALGSDEEIWVHCGAGFRAAVAASRLARWGLKPVLIDDAFENCIVAGLEVETVDR